MSSYFNINVDNIGIYSTLKLIFVVFNYKNSAVFSQDIKLPILIYINKYYFILLNNLNNLNYSIILFPTFFLYDFSGPFAFNDWFKKIKIFLEV